MTGRKQPMKRAAYRIAAKLRIIDGARLTRPYIYY
ncbi:cittilin family RiPP precursor [Nocardiopsis sp. YSL2]|nr:cittilin family RiPP precursor [Nocardiopsis sp. YSL2]